MSELRKFKRYSEYVQKPFSPEKYAPVGARPKNSKGDNPGWRSKVKTIHANGAILKTEVPIKAGGYIHKTRYKAMRKGF